MEELISYQEFAASVKAKYPQYQNVDDYTLATKMIEKYPQYAGRVSLEKKNQVENQSAQETQTVQAVQGVDTTVSGSEGGSSESSIRDIGEYYTNKAERTGRQRLVDSFFIGSNAVQNEEDRQGSMLQQQQTDALEGAVGQVVEDNQPQQEQPQGVVSIEEWENKRTSAQRFWGSFTQGGTATGGRGVNEKDKSQLWQDSALGGLSRLNEAIASVPEAIYDIASIPQNAVAAIFDKPEWEVSSEKFKETYGVKNNILDYYVNETKAISARKERYIQENYSNGSISKNISEGNFSDAFDLLISGTIESAPISLAIMASGGKFGMARTAIGATVAFTEAERRELRELFPNATEAEITTKAVMSAAAESVFESLGTGTIGAVWKDMIKKEGVEVGSKLFRNNMVEAYKRLLKDPRYGMLAGASGEGIEEAITQLTQNMIKGKPAMEGVMDAFLLGMGSGGIMTAPVQAVNYQNYVAEKKVERATQQANQQAPTQEQATQEQATQEQAPTQEQTVDTSKNVKVVGVDKAAQEPTTSRTRIANEEEALQYRDNLKQAKEDNPDVYWSVGTPKRIEVQKGKVIQTEDGSALVTSRGEIKGLYRNPDSQAKGVASELLERAVEEGGVSLDNFDGFLTSIYEKAGFRVVGRVAFDENYAPEGWDKQKHGTPDVVGMVYDPNNTLNIKEKQYKSYNAMMGAKIAYANEAKTNLAEQQQLDTLNQIIENTKSNTKKTIIDRAYNAVKVLQKISPNTKVTVYNNTNTFKKKAKDLGITDPAGAFYDPKTDRIYVSSELANDRSVAHEVFHAVLNNKFKSNEGQINEAARQLMEAIAPSLSPDLRQRLDNFANNYDETVQNEEKLSELFSILAESNNAGSLRSKSIIRDFIEKIAQLLGLKNTISNREAVELINTLATDFKVGDVTSDKTLNALNKKSILRVKGGIATTAKRQATQLKAREESLAEFGLTGKKTYNVREIAEALQERTRKIYRHFRADNKSEQAKQTISEYMVDEILFDIEANTDNSAVGWYTEKYQESLDIISEVDSSLKEQDNRDLFTMFLAVTSDGQKVGKNFELAYKAYQEYQKNGSVDATKFTAGDRTKSIQTNIGNINRLLSTMTPSEAKAYLLNENTVSEIKKEGKAKGQEYKSNFLANELVPKSAAVFGEKLGMFYANLSGSTGYLTMDRWWSRTFNRYRGELIPRVRGLKGDNAKGGKKTGVAAFKELIGKPNISDNKALEIARREAIKYKDRGFKGGNAVEKAANTIYKAAYVELNDAPFNAGDRSFMIETTKLAQVKLKEKGYDFSIADMQAILWYFEKMLYIELGGKAPKGISYADAARALVDKAQLEDQAPQVNDDSIEIDPNADLADVSEAVDNVNLSSISGKVNNGKKLQSYTPTNKVLDVVKEGRKNGISDDIIRKYLENQGVKPDVIEAALNGTLEYDQQPAGSMLKEIARQSREQMDKKNPTLHRKWNSLVNSFIDEFVDRQGTVKRVLRNAGLNRVNAYLVNAAGASSNAKFLVERAYDKTFRGLTNKQIESLEEIIFARRVIAIDNNRAERLAEAKAKLDSFENKKIEDIKKKPKKERTKDENTLLLGYNSAVEMVDNLSKPFKHPNGYNRDMAKRDLDGYKDEMGAEAYADLDRRATNYFSEFKGLLAKMNEEGLISQATYDRFANIDYQPRQFLDFLEDLHGNFVVEALNDADNIPLSQDQIRSLKQGSEGSLNMDAWGILSAAMLTRSRAIASNRVNRAFAEEYNKTLAEYENLKAKQNPTKKEIERIRNIEILKENVLVDEIVDFTDGFNPKYKLQGEKLKGWKPVYYFTNGVRNRIYMRDNFYNKYSDSNNQYLGATAREVINIGSGTAFVKSLATGNNPTFFITNTPRDFMFVLNFSKEYGNFLPVESIKLFRDMLRGIKDVTTGTPNFEKYLEHGGGMDFLALQGKLREKGLLQGAMDAVVSQKNQDKVFKNKFKVGMDKFNLASEVGLRMAVFNKSIANQLKKRGVADIETLPKQEQNDIYANAVKAARELTDFSQGGKMIKMLDAGVPYLNAATQGTRAAASSFKQNPVEVSVRMLQSVAFVGGMMVANTMALIGFMRDDDDEETQGLSNADIYFETIKRVSEYDKLNYYVIPTGVRDENGNWEYYRVAKAQALSPILNMSEHYFRKALAESSNNVFSEDLTDIMNKTIQRNILPIELNAKTMLNRIPAVSLASALNGIDPYTGNPLDWKRGQGMPVAIEGIDNDKVEDIFKVIGEATDYSPVRLQKAMESFFTTPATNPYVGMAYAFGNAVVNTKGISGLQDAGMGILEQAGKRVRKVTSDYNIVALAEERLEPAIADAMRRQIKSEKAVKDAAKAYKKSGNDADAFKVLKEELEKNPDYTDEIGKWFENEVNKDRGVNPLVGKLSRTNYKEVRAIYLVDYFGDALLRENVDEDTAKVISDLRDARVIDEQVLKYYTEMLQGKKD